MGENPKQTACDFQFKNRILQLTYFCGSALLCQQGGNFDVIQRSKYNVEAYFSVVGMSHDISQNRTDYLFLDCFKKIPLSFLDPLWICLEKAFRRFHIFILFTFTITILTIHKMC